MPSKIDELSSEGKMEVKDLIESRPLFDRGDFQGAVEVLAMREFGSTMGADARKLQKEIDNMVEKEYGFR